MDNIRKLCYHKLMTEGPPSEENTNEIESPEHILTREEIVKEIEHHIQRHIQNEEINRRMDRDGYFSSKGVDWVTKFTNTGMFNIEEIHTLFREQMRMQLVPEPVRYLVGRVLSHNNEIHFFEATIRGEKPDEVIVFTYLRKGKFENNESMTSNIIVLYKGADGVTVEGRNLAEYSERKSKWTRLTDPPPRGTMANSLSSEGREQTTSPDEEVSLGSKEIIEDIEVLLNIEKVGDETDKRELQEIWLFMTSTEERSSEECQNHVDHFGEFIVRNPVLGRCDWRMNVSKRLKEIGYQIRINNAWKELDKPNPNLLNVLYGMKMPLDPTFPISNNMRAEITRLKEEIHTRGLDTQISSFMQDLSQIVGELRPLFPNSQSLPTWIDGLCDEMPMYVDQVKNFALKKRKSAQDSGNEIQPPLIDIIDRIENILNQIEGKTE